MLEVILKGHDKYYGVSDVVRMFAGVPEEQKDEGKVTAAEGPDITLINELLPDGRSVTYSGDKEERSRDLFIWLYPILQRSKCRGDALPE